MLSPPSRLRAPAPAARPSGGAERARADIAAEIAAGRASFDAIRRQAEHVEREMARVGGFLARAPKVDRATARDGQVHREARALHELASALYEANRGVRAHLVAALQLHGSWFTDLLPAAAAFNAECGDLLAWSDAIAERPYGMAVAAYMRPVNYSGYY